MVTAVEPLKQPGDEKLDLLMRTDGTMFPDFPDCPERLQLPANPQLGDFSFPSRSPVEVIIGVRSQRTSISLPCDTLSCTKWYALNTHNRILSCVCPQPCGVIDDRCTFPRERRSIKSVMYVDVQADCASPERLSLRIKSILCRVRGEQGS